MTFYTDGDGEISPVEFDQMKETTEYKEAYRLFDQDGDGDITADELIQILLKLGEVPGDLALYFNQMSEEISTDYTGVINFLTVLIRYSKWRK